MYNKKNSISIQNHKKKTASTKFFMTFALLMVVLFTLSACQSASDDTGSNAISSNDIDTAENNTPETPLENEQTATPESDDDVASAETDPSEAASYYFDDLALKSLSGEEKSLFDYEGDLIILNFWATWCTYCEQEMPLLDELHQQDGISVIAIDVGEDADTVQEYVDRYDYHLDFYLDEDSELASTFSVSAFPTTFFIGPDFEYYYSYPGMLTEEYLTQILDAIENYQASKPAAE